MKKKGEQKRRRACGGRATRSDIIFQRQDSLHEKAAVPGMLRLIWLGGKHYDFSWH